MINEKEVHSLLRQNFPELEMNVNAANSDINIFQAIGGFIQFTKQCAKSGNLNQLRNCLAVANELADKGNARVIMAIENIYVFSLSELLDGFSSLQQQVHALLPESLKKMYRKQVQSCYP